MVKIINIYIKGHNYKHDLFELIRTFFNKLEINFIKHKDLDKEYEYLLISEYKKTNNEYTSITRLFVNGGLVKEVIIYTADIDIFLYSKTRIKKLAIKKGIYECLSKYLNKTLPWGILTGIRPVKVIHELIDGNISNKKIIKILEDHYKFENSKAKLILDIALSQRKHIYPKEKDKFSIYINIPFCPSKCSYCSFASFEIKKYKSEVSDYIDTLVFEIKASKDIFKGKKLNTVYIGGGTPTSLKTDELERIVSEVKNIFPEEIREFTVEAGRPDTINKEKLEMLKKYGVNRISINPQTFNNKTLRKIKRDHDAASIKESYHLAKCVGFDTINMDIILGLPGETSLELERTLEEIKSLNPDNLTVHVLSLKRGSNLYKSTNKKFSSQVNIEEMLKMSYDYALKEDYFPYYMYRQKQILGNLENVGYAKKNKECIYNISMMEEKETIFGFGLGAVSKIYDPINDRVKRIPNFKSLYHYINRINELIENKRIKED